MHSIELKWIHSLDAIMFTHTHTYIIVKIAEMNSGDLKMYKYVKISKLNFFTITILSLHCICSESKNLCLMFIRNELHNWGSEETKTKQKSTSNQIELNCTVKHKQKYNKPKLSNLFGFAPLLCIALSHEALKAH